MFHNHNIKSIKMQLIMRCNQILLQLHISNNVGNDKVIVGLNYSHLYYQIVIHYDLSLSPTVFKKFKTISYPFYEQIEIEHFCYLNQIKMFSYAIATYSVALTILAQEISN